MGGPVDYPAFLDLVESARLPLGNPTLLQTVCTAIAPRWEELPPACVECRRTESLGFELGASDDASIVQEFLATSAAKALAAMAPDQVLVHAAQYWDQVSLRFLERFARERRPGTTLAIELPERLIAAPRYRTLASLATLTVEKTDSGWPGKTSDAERMLALSPTGLPLETLSRLGADGPEAAVPFTWPDGQPALALPAGRARAVRRTMARKERSRLHAILFDAFPTRGWNYIRRGFHSLRSDKLDCLLRQHAVVLPGLAAIGFEHVYRHLAALARRLPEREAFKVHLNAARIAPRLPGRRGIGRSIGHFERARSACASPDARFEVGAELANLLANRRDPANLRRARILYDEIFPLIEAIGDAELRLRAKLRWRNGKALVEYHEKNDDVALQLELEALSISEEASCPTVARWAEPLVRMNMCKLLLKRFADYGGALKIVEPLLRSDDFETRWNTQQNLARIEFDKGNYDRVVQLLSVDEDVLPTSYRSEADLLQDLILLTISLLVIGEDEGAKEHILRAERIASGNDLSATHDLLSDLKALIAARSSGTRTSSEKAAGDAIVRAKRSGAEGKGAKVAATCPTMRPGRKLDIAQVAGA